MSLVLPTEDRLPWHHPLPHQWSPWKRAFAWLPIDFVAPKVKSGRIWWVSYEYRTSKPDGNWANVTWTEARLADGRILLNYAEDMWDGMGG